MTSRRCSTTSVGWRMPAVTTPPPSRWRVGRSSSVPAAPGRGIRRPCSIAAHSPRSSTDSDGRTRRNATIRDIVDDLSAGLGDGHPEVAVALNNLAAIVQRRGDLDEAERLYRRVIEIKMERLGADSPSLAVAFNNLGTVLRAQGRHAEAGAQYEHALRLLEARGRRGPPPAAHDQEKPGPPRRRRGLNPQRPVLAGSPCRSIDTIRPPRTVNEATMRGCPGRSMTIPGSPLTTAGRAGPRKPRNRSA